MRNSVTIRAAHDHELDEIMALDHATLPEAPPYDDTEWWGAWRDHELVGYAGARLLTSGAWFLSRAGVVLSARGQGLQRRLIRARVARARALLCPRAVTYTMPDNVPSMRSLVACGFKPYAPAVAYAGAEMVYWSRASG